MVESAGLVVYRGKGTDLEVLLVHPSGNYNRGAAWGIPKGLPDGDEPLAQTAVRETREETGLDLSSALGTGLVPLGHVEYKRSRKRIHAFAAPAPAGAEPTVACWEIDQAEFLPMKKRGGGFIPINCRCWTNWWKFLARAKRTSIDQTAQFPLLARRTFGFPCSMTTLFCTARCTCLSPSIGATSSIWMPRVVYCPRKAKTWRGVGERPIRSLIGRRRCVTAYEAPIDLPELAP